MTNDHDTAVACSVCHTEETTARTVTTKLRRCSRCQGPERYCSVTCQEWDWKQGTHQQKCRQRQRQQRAWKELQNLVVSSSVSDATHDYHVAMDHVQQQQQQQTLQQEKKAVKRKQETAATTTTSKKIIPHNSDHNYDEPEDQEQRPSPSSPFTMTTTTADHECEMETITTATETGLLPPRQQQPPLQDTIWTDWHMQVQDLKHLSCFQIQLQATRGNGNENDDSQCSSLFSCRPLETTTTTVTATTRLGLFHHFAAVPMTTMTTL
jgi:hypothetical protein